MSCSRTPITRIVENLVVMRSEYPASIACFFAALAQALIASSLNPCRLLWVMEACCWQCSVARNVRHLWLSCLPFGSLASIAYFYAALAQALNGTPGSAVAHSVATVMRLCPSYILKRASCAACTYLYGIVV